MPGRGNSSIFVTSYKFRREMVITLRLTFVTLLATAFTFTSAQDHQAHSKHQGSRPVNVEPQPFISHAARIAEALNFAGSSLSIRDQKKLKQLQQQKPSAQTVAEVQKIFDPYCLAIVNINAESRVKVDRGPAESKLTQAGWTIFLVKVYPSPAHRHRPGTACCRAPPRPSARARWPGD